MVRDELHFAPFSFIKINLNTTENREPSYSFWRTGKRLELNKKTSKLWMFRLWLKSPNVTMFFLMKTIILRYLE